MTTDWLELLATASLALAFLCATIIIGLLYARPQKMWIMNIVWPVTALYFGPISVWGLWRMGTPPASPVHRARQDAGHKRESKPFWQQVAVAVTHCGAGCTLGDMIGEWLIFAFGWTLFGEKLYAELLVDFPLAFGLGMIFQYFTIAPMRGLGVKAGLIAAVQADAISIIAFQVGLFAWMTFTAFVLFPGQSIASWNHWFQMQIGMVVGFCTSYPANWLLLSKGVKEPM